MSEIAPREIQWIHGVLQKITKCPTCGIDIIEDKEVTFKIKMFPPLAEEKNWYCKNCKSIFVLGLRQSIKEPHKNQQNDS